MTTYAWIVILLSALAIGLAIIGVVSKKSLLIFVAAAIHIIMGFITLPSIGLYIIGLAVLEIVLGIVMATKKVSTA
ncbi:hypothetical protein DH09_00035 (plasmid) [Bacillaceae bacterium JMAK1]|nr:hypothetical protein DH09_00035 [Bacillaceae bacterium JMAK1]